MRSVSIESLEGRNLFAATATLNGGVLNIAGTDGTDNVNLSKSGSDLVVKLNGSTKKFAYAAVQSVTANLKGSNDTFDASDSITRTMTVNGDSGNDTIKTGNGTDYINGGSGNDTINPRAGKANVDGGSGTDTLDWSGRTNDLDITLDNYANDGASGENGNIKNTVENIKSGSGDDEIFGSDTKNVIYGNAGDDSIYGLGGSDELHGGQDADYIYAGTGNDSVWGDSGKDTLSGGDDADKIFANDGQTDYITASDEDTVTSNNGDVFYFGFGGPTEIE